MTDARALTTARSELPPGSPALASALSRGGVQLLQLRMWSEADSILRECLKIREQISPDAAVNFNVKSLIGQALLGLGKSEIAHDPTAGRLKIDEAEKWLVDGYEGMIARLTQIPPDGRIRIKETLQYLVELYALTERPDKASSYRTKVEMFD